MRKIFILLIPMLIIASCTTPFDDSSIWKEFDELENKINNIDGTNTSDCTIANNKIYYTTSDG